MTEKLLKATLNPNSHTHTHTIWEYVFFLGKLAPLVDIDIGAGFQAWVNLSFVYCGEVIFTQVVRVREPVGKLRLLIAEKLCLYAR